MKLRKFLAICLVLVLVLGMAACGGSSSDEDTTSNADKTELVVIDSEWYGLDTYQLDSSSNGQGFVSATPFTWDSDNSCIADNVCTDWTVSEDGLTVTFNVPEGLTYSTGETVEPEDVVASLEHGLEVSPYADGYDNIESMDIDGRQVTLHLSHYSSAMEYYFCADFICIIDKDELDTMTNEELMWGCHPYGPYYLAEDGYVSGSEVNLVRNDNYKCFNPKTDNQGPWNFETVKFRFNVEDFTATEELVNGTVDLLMTMSKEQRLELEGQEGVTVINASYPCINFLELNADSPVFSDINVRKALALSIDRESIAEIAEGSVTPAYSYIYDTVQCFSQDAYDWYKANLSNDKEKAKQLLDEAGWVDTDGDGIREKDGQKLEFTIDSWSSWSTITQAMANQLLEVGFQMDIEVIDWNYINENMRNDDYDAGERGLGWAEPILVLNMAYYDPDAPGNDDEYKALVQACQEETDSQARVQRVYDAQMKIFESVELIPLFGDNDYDAMNSELQGYVVNSDGTSTLNNLRYE